MRVGFLGAYSIDNTGDLIVGLATRQAIRERTRCEEIVLSVDMPQKLWRHDWGIERGGGVEIRRVAPHATDFSDDLDALVIGGGGIVMPADGFAPFRNWGKAPAAWNAVCSQNTPWFEPAHAAFYANVKQACERLRYVSVRNATTEQLLRRCGYTGAIERVPDPSIVFTSEPVAVPELRGERPLVGVSVGNAFSDRRCTKFFEELLGELERLAATRAIDLVVFPFGRVYGDVELAKRAAARMPHARLVDDELGPIATWQLVGTLDLHICARLHAMLAAYTQGVPFLVCDEYLSDLTATSKIREFVVERGLEPCYIVPMLAVSMARRIAIALADRRTAPEALAADRTALARHFDRLVGALGLT